MLGNTHLAVGVAASLALAQPETTAACFISIMSGAVGGTICDVDTVRNSRGTGTMQGQIFAGSLTAAVLVLDAIFKTGIWNGFTSGNSKTIMTGVCLFTLLWILGYCSGHRSFTHSLAAMILFTYAVNLIYPPLFPGFLAAYGSHLVLDLLNKKPLRLFYPLRTGICFGVFYVKSKVNKALLYAGNLVSVFWILRLVFLQ